MSREQRELLLRPIPFLERSEAAYAKVRDRLFTAAPADLHDDLTALESLAARARAVIQSREHAWQEMVQDDERQPASVGE